MRHPQDPGIQMAVWVAFLNGRQASGGERGKSAGAQHVPPVSRRLAFLGATLSPEACWCSGDTYHRAWSRSLQWNGSRLSVHNPERSMSGTPQKKLKYIWKKVQVFYTKNNEYRFDLELQVLVQSAVPVSKGVDWFWLIFNDTLLVHSEWEIRS